MNDKVHTFLERCGKIKLVAEKLQTILFVVNSLQFASQCLIILKRDKPAVNRTGPWNHDIMLSKGILSPSKKSVFSYHTQNYSFGG